MRVPFMDLSKIHKPIRAEITEAINEVVNKGDFILGGKVGEFEKEFSAYCGCKFGIGVSSGTDAIFLAVKALGIGPGDEVLVPANTFIATALGVTFAGAAPILVDADPLNYNINLENIEKKITAKTKAIIPVHLYGQPVAMDRISALATKHGLKVIEDACQAHGAAYKGKKTGSFGDIGCFSFYPAKNLGAFGDGGMVVTNDENLYNKIRILRAYGSEKKYVHDEIGYNMRLDTMHAAVLSVKLKYLDSWNEQRNAAAKKYDELLRGTEFGIFQTVRDAYHVYHLYVIRSRRRDELSKYLGENGIGTTIHYPIPIHKTGAYKYLGHKDGDFPVVDKFSGEIISLPMFPGITDEEIEYVARTLKNFK
jgi:dTDP-4-amino-4,6-dideoxygalactose transaminase